MTSQETRLKEIKESVKIFKFIATEELQFLLDLVEELELNKLEYKIWKDAV